MATPEVLEKLTRTQEELAELDRRLGSVEDAIGALILPRPPLYYSSPSPRQKIKCKVCGYEYTTPPNFCPKCLTPPPKKSPSPQRYWVVIYRRRRPRGLRIRIPEGYEELSSSSQIFCDICGDITVTYKPIKVEFPDKSKLVINVCLECWNKWFEKKSRKLRVARLAKVLTESPHLNPSRWVLEMYPLDVLAWRRSLIELAGKPLTPSEARLVHSYDDYLGRKGYLTSRQIAVLGEIARRHDVELPAIPERVT